MFGDGDRCFGFGKIGSLGGGGQRLGRGHDAIPDRHEHPCARFQEPTRFGKKLSKVVLAVNVGRRLMRHHPVERSIRKVDGVQHASADAAVQIGIASQLCDAVARGMDRFSLGIASKHLEAQPDERLRLVSVPAPQVQNAAIHRYRCQRAQQVGGRGLHSRQDFTARGASLMGGTCILAVPAH